MKKRAALTNSKTRGSQEVEPFILKTIPGHDKYEKKEIIAYAEILIYNIPTRDWFYTKCQKDSIQDKEYHHTGIPSEGSAPSLIITQDIVTEFKYDIATEREWPV